MAIRHELSWSASRRAGFRACQRRYYFDYYLSWGGWNASADPQRREAYLLKKMTRMPMLAGDLVHRAIQRWIEGREQGRVGSAEEACAWAVAQLREKYKESRDGKWKMRPSKLCHLGEHRYSEPCIDESTGAAGEYGRRFVGRIEDALGCFFSSPELADARAVEPKDFLACEEMSTFQLFDTKVYAVPDFAYRDSSGLVHILDWKTGNPRDADRFQLAVYVFYAQDRWDVAPSDVVCKDVYLTRGEVVAVDFSSGELDSVLADIEMSLGEMRQVHFDADAAAGDRERFPMTAEDEAGLRECRGCNYRELCGRA